jgi:hypothetical protein
MYRLLALAGGVGIALCVSGVALSLSPIKSGSPTSTVAQVDRTNKGDRIAPPRAADQQPAKIVTVEVIGLTEAAIVYRDRSGNVLFRTDPVANVTVIAKGTPLPEVTVRERAEEIVTPLPVPQKAPRERLIGCDPVASPLSSPAFADMFGRCLSAAPTGRTVASAD